MEGKGITNRGIVINMVKSQNRIIKKPRILGKTIRNRFDQPKSSSLLTSYLYLLAIPTTTPPLIFFYP